MKRSTCKLFVWLGAIWLSLLAIVYITLTVSTCQRMDFGVYGQAGGSCFVIGAVMLLAFLIPGAPAIVLIIIGWVKWNSEEEYKNIIARGKVHVNVHASERDLRRIDAHLRTKRTSASKNNPTPNKEETSSPGSAIHCTNCGTKADKQAKFCRNCGHKSET